jgi:polyhydroxybutyrate depolymerase
MATRSLKLESPVTETPMNRRPVFLSCTPFAACALSALFAQEPPREGIRAKVRERVEKRIEDRKSEERRTESRPTAGTQERSLELTGQRRTYRLHLPPRFTPERPVPLVIALHGAAGNGFIMEVLTGFDELADRHGFAVAYPDGEQAVWRFWEAAGTKLPSRSKTDDIAFLTGLIDQLVREHIADSRRVYVTGISNGAYMTNRLACVAADRIAAIAPVAGTIPKHLAEEWKPSRAVPVIYWHGSEDKLVGIDGADFISQRSISLSADELVSWWVRHNGSTSPPRVEAVADPEDDGTRVECRTYSAGPKGAATVFYLVRGGGHTWPGRPFQPEWMLGKTSRDLNASAVIWDFFSKCQRSTPP